MCNLHQLYVGREWLLPKLALILEQRAMSALSRQIAALHKMSHYHYCICMQGEIRSLLVGL